MQTVCSVAGESWRMESDEVRKQFAELGKLEEKMHKAAFPNYKFRPKKSGDLS